MHFGVGVAVHAALPSGFGDGSHAGMQICGFKEYDNDDLMEKLGAVILLPNEFTK